MGSNIRCKRRGYGGLQGVTGGCRGLEGVTGGYKRLQGFTRGYIGLQGITGDYKGLQGVTEGYKMFQGVTGGYKGLQGVTGVYKGSIIPVVAKVFERIVYDQLYRYLTENKLLCCYQSGFRTLHSTVTALIEATDSWSLNVDRGFVNAQGHPTRI